MAQDTTPALVLYVGQLVDGIWRTRFEVPFDKGSFGEIKVAFVRRGLTNYEYNPGTYEVHGYLYAWNGGVYTKTEEPTTDTPLYNKDDEPTGDTWEEGMYREPKNDIFTKAYVEWTGSAITDEDVICITRETESKQPYVYPNNQKHIERALDNLSRQVQELEKKAENALLVDPSWMPEDDGGIEDPNKMDPITWLQTIVRSKGNTLRELRVDGDYAEYTTDDPDSDTKTWNVIAGVKTGNAGVVSHIREVKYTDEDNVDHWHLQYSVDGGQTWKNAGTGSEASWGTILGNIEDQTDLFERFVKKDGDTMTGPLKFFPTDAQHGGGIRANTLVGGVEFADTDDAYESRTIGGFLSVGIVPRDDLQNVGTSSYKWGTVYAHRLNNGFDLTIPAKTGVLATKADVDEAANSGVSLTDKGVWYAKMYAATVVPTGAEYDGRNYADFSQTDAQDNPIIVIYEGQNGAWVQVDSITPPASYNGFVIITSKIWDIPEQTGQQGGQVLWNHTAQTFTPYPKMVSLENAALTGNSTVQMSPTPTNDAIISKQYMQNYVADMIAGLDVPALFDFKWKDCVFTRTGWVSTSVGWISKATAPLAYQHLVDDYSDAPYLSIKTRYDHGGQTDYIIYYRDSSRDTTSPGGALPVLTPIYAWTTDNASAEHATLYSDRVESFPALLYYISESTLHDTVNTTPLEGYKYKKETIAGIDVNYCQTTDGHKIVLADQESAVAAIYAATGIAWYYILDTDNEQFKLPTTIYAFVGSRDTVGGYVEQSLPNHTHTYRRPSTSSKRGSGSHGTAGDGLVTETSSGASGGVYQDNAPVQQRATQMNLYFYVGLPE